MNTPICDFLASYASSSPIRMHMPGHKGAKEADAFYKALAKLNAAFKK